MRSRIPGIFLLLLLAICGFASWLLLPHRRADSGTLSFTAATFAGLPGWAKDDLRPGLNAFRRSCAVILHNTPDAELGRYAGAAADWQQVCRAAILVRADAGAAHQFFENYFIPLQVGGDAFVTGYYETLLHGSRTRHDAFQTPVYELPRDLVSVDLGAFRPQWKGEHFAGRQVGQRLVPYPSRAGIDANPPAAAILFYCNDPVSVFFLHIQGSGRVLLDDGSIIRVSYAGQNGRPYTAIGRTLVHSGALNRHDVSMQTIRAWLTSNPSQARQVMQTNESYVFFKEMPLGESSLGSAGTQGVALTPLASIAVDARFHVLGVPVFVDTTLPDGQPLQNLFIAQDTGGAIRGPARADIFFGFGASAENLAGNMKSSGRLFVLLPKSLAARIAP